MQGGKIDSGQRMGYAYVVAISSSSHPSPSSTPLLPSATSLVVAGIDVTSAITPPSSVSNPSPPPLIPLPPHATSGTVADTDVTGAAIEPSAAITQPSSTSTYLSKPPLASSASSSGVEDLGLTGAVTGTAINLAAPSFKAAS